MALPVTCTRLTCCVMSVIIACNGFSCAQKTHLSYLDEFLEEVRANVLVLHLQNYGLAGVCSSCARTDELEGPSAAKMDGLFWNVEWKSERTRPLHGHSVKPVRGHETVPKRACSVAELQIFDAREVQEAVAERVSGKV